MADIKKIWTDILEVLESELSAVAFDVWIKNLTPITLDKDNNIVLMAGSISSRNHVANRYCDDIVKVLSKTQDFSYITGVIFISPSERENYETETSDTPAPYEYKPAATPSISFNPKYTFDTFVVGKSNQFAAAAARAVAEQPSEKFNPLFIYGGVGLGKTHLMNAIGNHLKLEHPGLKVLYCSCERFTNELIQAIRGGRGQGLSQEFREKYRSIDVLMIDDIQFIAGKTSTQEEFFHTFNDLYQNQKQIIISSDRPAKEISPLDERLRTRFEWGISADIEPPDIETRIAILQNKVQQNKFSVSNEVLTMIAEKVKSNIREMEGLLTRVVFYASLNDRPASDVVIAQEALKEYTDDKKQSVDAYGVIDAVCRYYSLDKASLIGKKKTKDIVDARQVAIYLVTEFLPDTPLTAIGQIFGGRDHTTIIHSRDKIAGCIKENSKLGTQVKDIKNTILKN